MVFNAPVVNVEGAADMGVAEVVTAQITHIFQNVIIEAPSPSAPATRKRIRLGTVLSAPSSVAPSQTLGGSSLGGGGGSLRKYI
jgi:hypothetical protein